MAHFAIVSAAEPTRKALLSVRIVARNRTEAVKEADNRFCPASHRSRGHVLSHCRRDGHGGGARTDRVAMSSGVRAGAPWMNANLQDAVGRLVERLDSEDPDVLNRDSTRKGKLGMAKAPTKHRAPWTAAEVRYVLLSGHYRKPLNFTFESLHAAREALNKLSRAAERISQNCPENTMLTVVDFGIFQEAWDTLNDDLNTPGALGAIFRALRTAIESTGKEAAATLASLNRLLRAMGIELPPCKKETTIPTEIQALADLRWSARTAKNWAESDALRDQLAALGWLVKDSKDGYALSPAH
jgi:hypothetical protein